jgi:hypothetical protein
MVDQLRQGDYYVFSAGSGGKHSAQHQSRGHECDLSLAHARSAILGPDLSSHSFRSAHAAQPDRAIGWRGRWRAADTAGYPGVPAGDRCGQGIHPQTAIAVARRLRLCARGRIDRRRNVARASGQFRRLGRRSDRYQHDSRCERRVADRDLDDRRPQDQGVGTGHGHH